MAMKDMTVRFESDERQTKSVSDVMCLVYQVLEEKGYNPIDQIVGYLLTEDPAYIPRRHDARQLIRQFGRDEIMEVLVREYLENHGTEL